MAKDKIPNISEAEWEVMKVLWRESPMTAKQIVVSLSEETDWKPKTIGTLISRLVKKNAVGYEQDGKTYHYFPAVKEEECIKAEGESFLQRIYGGSLKPMLAHFIEEEKLSPEEIEDLKRLLDHKKGQ